MPKRLSCRHSVSAGWAAGRTGLPTGLDGCLYRNKKLIKIHIRMRFPLADPEKFQTHLVGEKFKVVALAIEIFHLRLGSYLNNGRILVAEK